MSHYSSDPSDFDAYAAEYDVALGRGIALSGERKEHFARRRVEWLWRCLRKRGDRPATVLDFGCGIGTNTGFLSSMEGVVSVIGVDISRRSLEIARRCHGNRAAFRGLREYEPEGRIDLAFTSGVFHHIEPSERPAALDYIYRALRPGGLLAFWENNAWNPAMRYAMWRIPFDRDARPISAPGARRLLRGAGFEVLRCDFLFIFPKALAALRGLEPRLVRLPLGAQYQVLCRKKG